MKNTTDKIKYDFSNPESQKLFEEFTTILADITKYVESKEEEIISEREELIHVQKEYENTREELIHVQREYENTREELMHVQVKQKESLEKLQLVTSGRYMIKAISRKTINYLLRILNYIPKKLVSKLKHLSK